MSEKTFRSNPPKRVIIDGVTVDFKKTYSDRPSGLYHPRTDGKYQALYPSIYSLELPSKYAYTKIYNFYAEEYLENRRLLTGNVWGFYLYLTSLRNRGYYLSIKGNGKTGEEEVRGLAQVYGISRRTAIDHLDHLEDCMLIHRVRRLDLQGMPNEIVIHLPKTPEELDRDGYHDWIVKRIKENATKSRRDGARVSGTSESGQNFNYVDRTVDGQSFDYGMIRRAFGQQALRFADWALMWFEKNWHFLRAEKRSFDHDVRKDLELELNGWGIYDRQRRHECFTAFGVFRKVYCPLDTELFA
jgi:hypothetical protein